MVSIETMKSQAQEEPADQNAHSDSEQSGTDDENTSAPEDIVQVRRNQNLQFQALWVWLLRLADKLSARC